MTPETLIEPIVVARKWIDDRIEGLLADEMFAARYKGTEGIIDNLSDLRAVIDEAIAMHDREKVMDDLAHIGLVLDAVSTKVIIKAIDLIRGHK